MKNILCLMSQYEWSMTAVLWHGTIASHRLLPPAPGCRENCLSKSCFYLWTAGWKNRNDNSHINPKVHFMVTTVGWGTAKNSVYAIIVCDIKCLSARKNLSTITCFFNISFLQHWYPEHTGAPRARDHWRWWHAAPRPGPGHRGHADRAAAPGRAGGFPHREVAAAAAEGAARADHQAAEPDQPPAAGAERLLVTWHSGDALLLVTPHTNTNTAAADDKKR